MKTQNYKVTQQGQPIPVQNSIKQADFDPKQRVVPVGGAPLPNRGNQVASTGQANQNLVENYAIGTDVAAVRGEDKQTVAQQRNATTYTKNSKGQFTY